MRIHGKVDDNQLDKVIGIDIHSMPLSANILRKKSHWTASRNEKKRIGGLAIIEICGAKRKFVNGPVSCVLTLFAPDNRKRDLANYCSVAEKAISDVMQDRVIGNDSQIKEVTFRTGGIDAGWPEGGVRYELFRHGEW